VRHVPLFVLLLLLSGCQSLRRVLPGGHEYPDRVEADEVPAALQEAQDAFNAGSTEVALGWARAASRAKNLSTVERNNVQSLLEQIATVRIEELSVPGADPDELVELYELELPRQLSVSAAVRAAHLMVEDGRRVKAFRLLERVDTRYPLHHERYAAANLLVDVGLELADDKSKFLWFYNRRNDGISVLEYLVLNAPWEPRCDEAYFKLGQIYEEDGNWELAVERHENLILYHPDSPLRPYAQGMIPHLRLASIESPEYDRNELVDARRELEQWLEQFAGEVDEDLERQVRIDLTDSLRRLADSDLGIARFYRRVDNDYGQDFHARRALNEAELAADEKRADKARALLTSRVPGEAETGDAVFQELPSDDLHLDTMTGAGEKP